MIRAAVVDNEPLARRNLISLLSRTGRVRVVGEAEDAHSGLRLCRLPGVDVAFLDVCLPGPNGLKLGAALSRQPRPPLLVFVTERAEHAVAAFRIHATDYLLKPPDTARIDEAVRHLEQRLRECRACLAGAEGEEAEAITEHRLPVRLRERDVARLLPRHEIVAALRSGRRTWIHTLDAEYPTYYPLSRVETWLGGAPFLRVARHAVVNTTLIDDIIHYGDRLYRLCLLDRSGTVVEVSRSAAASFVTLLRSPLASGAESLPDPRPRHATQFETSPAG